MEARQNTLTITGLRTEFLTPEGPLAAVDGVDLAIPRGSIVGLVGESGCGKSVTALSVLGLVPPAGRVAAGEIRFGETDLRTLGEGALRKLRGNRIAMIFQDPMTSLNPVYPVGRQVAEVLRLHRRLDRWAAKARTVELFQQVGIPDPAARYDAYPRQLSGGKTGNQAGDSGGPGRTPGWYTAGPPSPPGRGWPSAGPGYRDGGGPGRGQRSPPPPQSVPRTSHRHSRTAGPPPPCCG